MKNLMQTMQSAIQRQDGARLSQLAGQSRQQQPQREDQAALVFNDLFRQLRATFPAITAHIKTQDDLNDFRRTWMMAFAENGINTIAQVNAGMQLARQQATPWVPSPGQFVAWAVRAAYASPGCRLTKNWLNWFIVTALNAAICPRRKPFRGSARLITGWLQHSIAACARTTGPRKNC
jgi:hypothetical protein